MRKITPYSIFYLLSCACVGLFAGSTIKDAINYNTTLNSAPFYVFVLANAVKFLVPCAVFVGIAYFLKKKQTNKVSVPESEKSRLELLKEFATYDRSKEESYDTEYSLGGNFPVILENYGFSEYIKDVDTASDEIVFNLLDFICDHFGHNGSVSLADKRDIAGLIGVKARHITCMPYEDPFDDCHVVVDC